MYFSGLSDSLVGVEANFFELHLRFRKYSAYISLLGGGRTPQVILSVHQNFTFREATFGKEGIDVEFWQSPTRT